MSDSNEIIWQGLLDEIYEVKAIRINESWANLILEKDGQLLDSREFPLAYGAIFGPDVADIDTWQKWAVERVDALEG